MNRRNVFIAFTIFVIFFFSALIIFIARGYQLDIKTAKVTPTGILVATSDPDGAEVLINGKLVTATNNTINLSPGKYLVKIQKEGFSPWEKSIPVKEGEVIKTSAYLFPNLPELRPLTFTGAKNALISPDGTKILYSVASASAEKNGLWTVDMSHPSLPNGLFSSADLRQISQNTPGAPLTEAKFLWSPDSKQILAYFGNHVPTVSSPSADLAYLLETDRLNTNLLPLTIPLTDLLTQWQELDNTRYQTETAKLSPTLFAVLATSSAKLDFSPDENKILYTATASAHLPTYLLTYLPGTDPTPETRQLEPGNSYVYDIKEDRNYLIANCLPDRQAGKLQIANCVWFPSSRHLLSVTNSQTSVMEYDGSNLAVIYAGPFEPDAVFPWPNWSKIVILTSLNNFSGVGENLYTINLR